MSRHPGEVMGYLAYAHPFLDGNGRTIMLNHGELATRAGFGVDWRQADKAGYLAALTRELDQPGKGELDDFLRPLMGPAITHRRASGMLAGLAGLGPRSAASGEDKIDTELGRARGASGKSGKRGNDADGDHGN